MMRDSNVKHRILLIEDDIDLCNILKRQLLKEMYEVHVCHDGQSGFRASMDSGFQLIVLDIMLPNMNGIDVLLKIRRRSIVPVLMLTAKDSEVDKIAGLRLGADDYMTKPFLINEFIARVQSLIRRYTVFESKTDVDSFLNFDGIQINTSMRNVLINDMEISLTAKEFDLLCFLATNQGRVFTKEQIYNHVWQESYQFDDSNIMSFISKLRKKIKNEVLNIEYIQTIHGIGYRFNREV